MEIKPLTNIDFKAICKAFNLAFSNYEIQLNDLQLQAMLQRRGFNPNLSFAAFDSNEIVAFTFNGVGDFNGTPTAYDTGTGTLKEYRGKGLATRIFEHSLPFLKNIGTKQYLLEVLQHNTKAVSVYRNLGFEVTRELNYFAQRNEEVNIETKRSDLSYSAKQIDIEKISLASTFWDFYPSWQNSFESIKRAAKDFVYLGIFAENRLIGYCVFEPNSGDITQIAVDKQNRRKGVASLLLREVIKINKNDTVKIVNTDISCDSITHFLNSKNINIKGKQFEMVKKI